MWVGNFPEDCVFVPPQESWQRTYSVRAGPSIPEEEKNFFFPSDPAKEVWGRRGVESPFYFWVLLLLGDGRREPFFLPAPRFFFFSAAGDNNAPPPYSWEGGSVSHVCVNERTVSVFLDAKKVGQALFP